MLRNERYVGQFVWNKRKWVKDPTTGKRRSVARPESEWVRLDRPDLAIVDRETWDRVQARHKRTARTRGERKRSASPHLLSGLLRCGVCEGALSIVSQRKKGTAKYSQYGCATRHSRGPSACANRTTTSELGLNAAVLRAVRIHLESPEVERWVAEVLAERQAKAKAPDLVAEIATAQARVDRVVDALAHIGHSDPLAKKLRDEEAKLAELQSRLAREGSRLPRPQVTLSGVIAAMGALDTLAAKSPDRARCALATVVASVTLTPEAGGRLRATLCLKNETATLASGRSVAETESASCGGLHPSVT